MDFDFFCDLLSEEQKTKVRQFLDVTDCGDVQSALGSLDRSHWNVEEAIGNYLETNESMPPIFDLPTDESSSDQQLLSDEAMNPNNLNAYEPAHADDAPMAADDDNLGFIPATTGDLPMDSVPYLQSDSVFPDDYDTVEEALEKFKTNFREEFCSEEGMQDRMPTFFMGTLPEAVRQSAEINKPLLLFINHTGSSNSTKFIENILCQEVICNLVKDNFLTFPWDVTTGKNYHYLLRQLSEANLESVYHRVENWVDCREAFPIFAVVVPDQHSYYVADFCEGNDSPDLVYAKLCSGIEQFAEATARYEAWKVHAAREREERANLRNEQEAEYNAALMRDAEERSRREHEERERQRRMDEVRKEEMKEVMRQQMMAAALPKEPEESEENTVAVRFRDPDGRQVVRRFRKTEKLQILVDFLSSQGFAHESFVFFNSDRKNIIASFDMRKTFGEADWPARETVVVERTSN